MSDEDNEIGNNLTRLRGARTQQEVAEAMRKLGWKWSQATVWSIEKGERPLRLAEARDLAALLSRSIEEFLVPSVEGMILDGLNQGIASIRQVREAMEQAVNTWELKREVLGGTINFAQETLEKPWEDADLRKRVERTAEVARELHSWTPESMVKSIMRERNGKHSEEG